MANPAPERRDDRLDQLVALVVELASGDRAARMRPSPAADDIDAVIVGINMLAEELQILNDDLEWRVTERTRQLEKAQQQLKQLALYDPLTGLANRTLLDEHLTMALGRAGRGAPLPAVLVLDLDGFKIVNDSFGHTVGDHLLVEVARRLRAVVRETDTVARLGGDEFALVVLDATPEHVVAMAERIRTAMQAPVPVGDRICWVGASIGVCFAANGQDASTLLRNADTAMYVAKSGTRGAVQIYEPAMHALALSHVQLADELRAAIAGHQIAVHYQLIVDLASGRPTGVEALARWQHPTRGLLAPADFIAVAEDTGLVTALDRLVLDTAVAALARWRAGWLGAEPFAVHVNIAPVELRSTRFAEDVLACLALHGVGPADLALEVTETQMMTDDPQTLAALKTLRAAGIGVAIDDFGAGYSSIGYVRRRLVDVVKIDRSLITGLDSDPQQRRVAAAILAVVDAFGLDAVAEGIETPAQAEYLRTLGCRYGQGYLWGRAVPEAGIVTRLASGRRDHPQ
jgi:diguanylate cyclase